MIQYIKNLIVMSKIEDIKPKNIVILTGSGISAESGISTYRDKNGLWQKHSVYEVSRPEAIELTPDKFFEFQNKKTTLLTNKQPNKAHISLSELEKNFNVTIITQNLDLLHEAAGASNVLHIHGKVKEAICHICKANVEYQLDIFGKNCIHCDKGLIRPNIVLFKERPLYLKESFSALSKADLFIQIGTSGSVYPAAQFVQQTNALKINISLSEPENISSFDYSLFGKATKIVPKLVRKLLKIK